MRVRLVRLFWIGAAALLGAAALVALVALLRGEFTDTDGKILGTLGTALLAGGTSLAGVALLERRDVLPLGWAVALGGLAAFVVLTIEVWRDFADEDRGLVTLLLLVGGLMVATARLLGSARLRWLFLTSTALTAVAVGGTVWAVLAEPDNDDWAKLLGSAWILAALSWFLVPVLGRTVRGDRDDDRRERLVASEPGRHEVELAEGEELVVRSGR